MQNAHTETRTARTGLLMRVKFDSSTLTVRMNSISALRYARLVLCPDRSLSVDGSVGSSHDYIFKSSPCMRTMAQMAAMLSYTVRRQRWNQRPVEGQTRNQRGACQCTQCSVKSG